MGGDGPCCGYTRKTVVMTFLFLSCLALVIWMLVVTSLEEQPRAKSGNQSANATIQLIVNERLALDLIEFNMTVPGEKAPKPTPPPKQAKIRTVNLVEKTEEETLCKCVCGFNVTKKQISKANPFFLDGKT